MPPRPLTVTSATRPGDDRQRRDEDLRVGADERRAPRGGQVLGRQRALDLGEVRRPVAEGQHEAEAEDDRDPVRVDRVGDVADAQPLPGVQPLLAELGAAHPVRQPVPAAHVVQRDDRQRDEGREDDEELQDLVVDRRGQAAERDVDEDDGRGDQDRDRDRPPEHEVDHQREREEVHARDEHGGDREAHGVPAGGSASLKRRRRYSGTLRTLAP